MSQPMSPPLISIIVPIFRVEEYLDRCVASIVGQTYRNLEIILVDDGSPDGCPAMCDAWKTKDSRITVIHQENAGLSQARNVGLALATGEYIGFVDSDDWIEPEMYEMLLGVIQETGADISICNLRADPVGEIVPVSNKGTNAKQELTPEESIRNYFTKLRFVVVWNKLYRKCILDSISFPIGKCYEDIYWTYKAMAKAQKIVYLDRVLYHNILRSGSISRNREHFYQIDRFGGWKESLDFCRQHYPSLESLALSNYLLTCYDLYIILALIERQYDQDGRIRCDLHRRFCEENWWSVVRKYPVKRIIRFLLFRFCPRLLVRILPFYSSPKSHSNSTGGV